MKYQVFGILWTVFNLALMLVMGIVGIYLLWLVVKALLREGDGFVLLYKRVEEGGYQWPRDRQEMQKFSWKETVSTCEVQV